MDIMSFRNQTRNLLYKKSEAIQAEVYKRVQLCLELLDTETMSIEGVAIIAAQVESELIKEDNQK